MMRSGKLAIEIVIVVAAAICGWMPTSAQDGPTPSATTPQANEPSQKQSHYSGLSDKELFDKCTIEMNNGNDDAALSMAMALLARYPFLQDQKRFHKLPGQTQKLLQDAGMRVEIVVASQQYFKQTGVRLAKISHGVSPPVITYQVEPDLTGLVGRVEHGVLVNLIVDERGNPQNVHVIASAGKEIDARAVRAVDQYRFKPAMENGKPVPVMLNVQVNID
jgi:TonB family protein